MLNARFASGSLCAQAPGSGPTPGICSVKILVSGSEMMPKISATTPFPFDSHGPGGKGGFESHAMERFRGVAGSGTWLVRVQVNVTPGTVFDLRYWTLAVTTSAP